MNHTTAWRRAAGAPELQLFEGGVTSTVTLSAEEQGGARERSEETLRHCAERLNGQLRTRSLDDSNRVTRALATASAVRKVSAHNDQRK